MKTHPKLVLTLVTVAVFLGLGTTLAVHNTARAATNTVAITNFQFTPGTTTVSVGDSVTWTNNAASTPHTSTSDSGLWNSGTLTGGQSFSFTFTTAGTFSYHCTIHPLMVGSIVATDASATATAIAPTPTTSPVTPPPAPATAAPTSPIPGGTPPPGAATLRATAPGAPAAGSGTESSRRSDTLIKGGLGLVGLAGAAFAVAIGARRRRL